MFPLATSYSNIALEALTRKIMQEKEIKGIGIKKSICRSQDDDDKESTEKCYNS